MAGAVNPVPVGLLQELARGAPKAEVRPTTGRQGSGERLDIEGWMQRFGIAAVQCKPWQTGRLWILEACPFDPSHTDRSAYIIQHASGAVDFGCHHASCQQHDWHTLRQLKEPERSARESAQVSATNGARMPAAQRPAVVVEQARPINETDMGNGIRFARLHAQKARYTLSHGWLIYDGTRWRPDPLGAQELAKEIIRALYVEAAEAADATARRRLASWALKSEENSRIQAMLTQARSEPGIALEGELLDQRPWLFNCANGTFDLMRGAIRRHDPTDLITLVSPVEYDEAAGCPRFLQFVIDVMAERLDLVDYLQQWLGHCLSGSTQMQEILFMHGAGANGKNTLMDLVANVMGDYADVAPKDWLMQRRQEAHSQETVSLMGKRLVIADETEQGGRFNESFLKKITGSGRLKGHFMRQNDISFTPEFKCVLLANHKPVVRGTDHAFWRRIPLTPFDVVFHEPDEGRLPVKDTTLPERLKAEMPGILAWLVRGALDWIRSGYRLPRPAVVQAATAGYREEMDLLGEFVTDCCDVAPGLSERAAALYAAYERWAGQGHASQVVFAASLGERGFEKRHTMQGRVYSGLALKEEEPPPPFIPEGRFDVT